MPTNQQGPASKFDAIATERDASGLTSSQVAERVALGLVNRPTRSRIADYGEIVVRNVFTLFNGLVVPAAIALFILGEYRSAWAVSAMAFINSAIGLVQEYRAKRHLELLSVLTQPAARVRRDGTATTIPASEIVVDDVVLISAGDAVVADGIVLQAQFLEIDESLLTGESDSVAKRPDERLMSGSNCIAGEAAFRADRIGGAAYAEQLSTEARHYRYTPSPVQQLIDTLIRVLTAAAIALCLLHVVLWQIRGFPVSDLWQMIAATVTSMVPQGLVLTATMVMTLGAVRMSRRGASVQHLSAVEAMASIDMLCLDKTGTLTTGRLTLDQIRSIATDDRELQSRLRLFAWASNDVTNRTLLAIRGSVGPPEVKWELIDQIAFKSQNRFSAVRVRQNDRVDTLVLGAIESLQPYLATASANLVDEAYRELMPTGLRLLLFAEAIEPSSEDFRNGSLNGLTLRPLAIVALRDELRPAASESLRALAAAGIHLKVLSGDNPATVHAAVSHLPLRQTLVRGDELEPAADRTRMILDNDIFARVTPRQKLDIMNALRQQGRRVGMIGDGINDLLTIKRADLGIAMGAGAGATKSVAGLVLVDNDFGLLPSVLQEGRQILNQLRALAKLFLLKNVYSLILIIAGLGVLRLGFPYLPQQVTLLNTLTIGGPALLFMFGRARADRNSQPTFLLEVGLFVLTAGFAISAAVLWIWLRATTSGDGIDLQRTILLTTLVLVGLGNAIIISNADRRLVVWAILAFLAYDIVLYWPRLADFFVLTPLPLDQWLTIAIVAILAMVPCTLAEWLSRRQWPASVA